MVLSLGHSKGMGYKISWAPKGLHLFILLSAPTIHINCSSTYIAYLPLGLTHRGCDCHTACFQSPLLTKVYHTKVFIKHLLLAMPALVAQQIISAEVRVSTEDLVSMLIHVQVFLQTSLILWIEHPWMTEVCWGTLGASKTEASKTECLFLKLVFTAYVPTSTLSQQNFIVQKSKLVSQ